MSQARRSSSDGPGIPVGPGLPIEDPSRAVPGAAEELDAASAAVAEDLPEPPELTEQQLEALLFVAERPLSRRELASIAGVDRGVVDERLGDLEVALAERGVRLLLDGDRVALATAPEAGPLIGRYVGADAIRLSPAALETLAIVAYRQPVTRAAIERIRGVDSDYTVRTLLHRRLVVELGRAETPGRPFLYGTGLDFLERFGLTSLEQLPPLPAEIAARLVEDGGDAVVPVDAAGLDSADAPADPGTPVGPSREESTEDPSSLD
jgi:segregation and condensation protein B